MGINKKPIKLTRSTNKKFPGWWTFPYQKVTYFIRFTTRGVKIVSFKGKKVITPKVVSKPKRKPKKPTKGKKTPKTGKKPKGEKKPKTGKKLKGEKKPKTGKKPKGEKKPKGKKPKKGETKPTKKHPGKPKKVTFKTFVTRFPGTWKFKFPKVSFNFVIKHKRITINKKPIKLTRSTNKKFPGWWTFPYQKVTYFIRFTT